MLFSTRLVLSALLALAVFAVPAAAQAAPAYTLVQAEADPHGTVQPDPAALGGKFVQQDGAYQPALIAPLPAAGASWVIWARIKNSNYQLKGIGADGKQTDLTWEWDKPAAWTWVSFGRHTRAELGAQFLLMRGDSATGTPGLDCAVLAESAMFDPNKDVAVPPAAPVTVSVDWQQTVAHATSLSYGLNAYGAFNPATTASPVYEANMAAMNPGLVRLHNWDMMQDSAASPSGWIDTAHKTWDAAKIRQALTGAFRYGPALMVNIPGWPSWMDTNNDGFLDADKTQQYAQFCAALVKIINKDIGRHVEYWEITNEKDEPYYADFHTDSGTLKNPNRPDRLDALAAIYNACAVAMKAVDPTIQTGGPALTNPYRPQVVQRFAEQTAPHLDFFSFHSYASGSKDDPDVQIYNAAASFGGAAKGVTDVLSKAVPGRRIPTFFDEYNISWTWQTHDPRMADVKGAVFDALAMASVATAGGTGAAAWNDKDGIYGKMDNDLHLRPSAQAFHLFNTSLRGSVARAATTDAQSIVPFAVRQGARHSVLLINRSGSSQSVRLQSSGWPLSAANAWTLHHLTDAGYAQTKAAALPKTLSLPANSLLLLTAP